MTKASSLFGGPIVDRNVFFFLDGESSPKKEYLELHEGETDRKRKTCQNRFVVAPVPRRLGKIDPAKAIAEARAKAAMFVAQRYRPTAHAKPALN